MMRCAERMGGAAILVEIIVDFNCQIVSYLVY
jgi:hypothetical protein